MTDRELLERAARAAGYSVHSNDDRAPGAYVVIDGDVRHWNPLADDGDALRLAVARLMDVYVSYSIVQVCVEGGPLVTETIFLNSDPAAATRRAIVRAAAAMAGE